MRQWYNHPVTTATSRLYVLDQLDEFPAIFARYLDAQAMFLFGSVAEGQAAHRSDLDLAVVPPSPRFRKRQLDNLSDLVRHGFIDRVGLVNLDTDDIELKAKVVRNQRLLFAAPYLGVQRKAIKRRLLNVNLEIVCNSKQATSRH